MALKIISHKSGDKLDVSLPLVSGTVIVSSDSTISVQNLSRDSDSVVWPVINGKFKFLVHLQAGKNEIQIQHKFQAIKFILEYKPLETKKFIRIVYIKCTDDEGLFQAPPEECNSIESASNRIVLGAQMLQTFTYDKFQDHNLSKKVFRLEEVDDDVVCHIFTSSLHLSEAYNMNEEELWSHFAVELMNSHLRVENDCKFLAFLSFTRYINELNVKPSNHKDILKLTKGQVALGGGGLALFGSGCLHTWSENLHQVAWRFGDKRKINRLKFMDDSANRGFYWACYSTGLGAVLHELGHTFDLGHTRGGIMGRGFDDIYKYFIVDMFYYDNLFQKEHNPFYFESVATHHTISLNPSTRKWSESDESSFKFSPDESSSKYSPDESFVEDNCFEAKSISDDISPRDDKPWRIPNPPDEHSCDTRFQNFGGAYWTRSSALILYYHKWFNENICSDQGSILLENSKLFSTIGIQIVEFRDCTGMLFHHLEFPEGGGALEVDLKSCDFSDFISSDSEDFSILAEDYRGNIFKAKLNRADII